MSAGHRIPLAEAREIAAEVVALLSPACERIEVAGSIRREAETCGDVEIVAISKQGEPPLDLFGQPIGDAPDALHDLCERLRVSGRLEKRFNKDGRPSWGRRLKWCYFWPSVAGWKWPEVVALDIYTCAPEQWGATLALRTGDADFSRRLVTSLAAGGYCPSHLQFKGWRVVERDTGAPLETPEEMDVFAALGMGYVEPRDRSAKASARLAGGAR